MPRSQMLHYLQNRFDKNVLRDFWVDLLGLADIKNFINITINLGEIIFEVREGDLAVEFDLLEPLVSNKRTRISELALDCLGLCVDNLEEADY